MRRWRWGFWGFWRFGRSCPADQGHCRPARQRRLRAQLGRDRPALRPRHLPAGRPGQHHDRHQRQPGKNRLQPLPCHHQRQPGLGTAVLATGHGLFAGQRRRHPSSPAARRRHGCPCTQHVGHAAGHGRVHAGCGRPRGSRHLCRQHVHQSAAAGGRPDLPSGDGQCGSGSARELHQQQQRHHPRTERPPLPLGLVR